MRSLVVDDELVALQMLKALLSEYGHCDTAANAPQALLMLSKSAQAHVPYDVIFLDIQMPMMNGLELCDRIETVEEIKHLRRAKKVFVSADSTPENVKGARARNCDAFMVKPVRREAIDERLAAWGFERTSIPKAPAKPARPEAKHTPPKSAR